MLTDDDDVGNNPSPPDSQASSVDGVFPNPPSKATHPFRIIEHDGASVHSMTSLGRVGRIFSGSDAISGMVTQNSAFKLFWMEDVEKFRPVSLFLFSKSSVYSDLSTSGVN